MKELPPPQRNEGDQPSAVSWRPSTTMANFAERSTNARQRSAMVLASRLVCRDRGDEDAAIGDALDQSLCLQYAHRLAHAGPADPGLLAELPLCQLLLRLEMHAQNGIPERASRELAQVRHVLDDPECP